MNSPLLHCRVLDILKQVARTILEEQNHSDKGLEETLILSEFSFFDMLLWISTSKQVNVQSTIYFCKTSRVIVYVSEYHGLLFYDLYEVNYHSCIVRIEDQCAPRCLG